MNSMTQPAVVDEAAMIHRDGARGVFIGWRSGRGGR
jgi:hypothetical protein